MNRDYGYYLSIPDQPTVTTVSSFVERIQALKHSDNIPVVYRGHASCSFKLSPAVFRNLGHRQNEAEMMRSVFASQPEAFADDVSTLDRLVRVQHFGLPTRLMDVTWNSLVALYFCCKSHPNNDGEVVALGWEPKKTKFFDSDTVSLLANLSYLSSGERSDMTTKTNESVDVFNEWDVVKRLVHFVKDEKPHFGNKINPKDLEIPVLVRPKHSNKRIVAQQGAFIIFGINHDSLFISEVDEYTRNQDDTYIIRHIIVASSAKKEILSQLDRIGISAQAMFPELEKAAEYVKGRFYSPD